VAELNAMAATPAVRLAVVIFILSDGIGYVSARSASDEPFINGSHVRFVPKRDTA